MNTIDNEHTVKHLNELLSYLHDSEKGYKECAEVISDVSLKPVFLSESTERSQMIKTLELHVRTLGGEPVESGSVAGPLHRLYVDLKAMIMGGKADTVLNEIKRGDNTLINSYKEVLRENPSLTLSQTLQAQLDHVQNILKRLDEISI